MSGIITDCDEAERVENSIRYRVLEESCANCANSCANYDKSGADPAIYCAKHRIRVETFGACQDYSCDATAEHSVIDFVEENGLEFLN